MEMDRKPTHQPVVDILLATYNGSQFLEAQMASLEAQTYGSWRLIVRDDGSSDRTRSLLLAWANRFPERITILNDEKENLGSSQNFSMLLEHSSAPYVALCDQDDVWLPDKIARTLERLRNLEAKSGSTVPHLIHTDLEVVNRQLAPTAKSFWKHQYVDPSNEAKMNRLLVQNVVTGCTAMLNRSLVNLAAPIPNEAIMHDWWIALTAAAFGHINHIDEATVLYRQHGGNDTGAKAWGPAFVLRQARSLCQRDSATASGLRATHVQARAFLDHFDDRLSSETAALVKAYARLPSQAPIGRRASLLRHGFLKTGALRNVGLFLSA
jgi:glycosyltransferase involved in cell wall biosynthesis